MTSDGSLGAAEQPKLTHLSSLGNPLVAAWEMELGKVREASQVPNCAGPELGSSFSSMEPV